MNSWGVAPEHDAVPVDWWGPFGANGPRLSVLDLVAGRVLEPDQAALLWTAVERGESICIAAGPSGAGKTTTLTAFFDAVHPRKRHIFIRGMYETFAFRRET